MITQKRIDMNRPLTEAQEKMLEELALRQAAPDNEFPELTQEQLRLSPQALSKARSLGKGYTSVLSRILENALNNPDVIRQNL